MTTKPAFSGVITALVTPFKDGAVDAQSFRRLIRQQLDQGIAGFVINGTTAESPCLLPAEVKSLFDLAKAEVAGQVPLIVGAGTNSTASTCALACEVSGWGPAALLVVVPYYNRPPQRGLIEHFKQVARASTVPIVLYNVPSRTVASLSPHAAISLSQVDNVAGLKDATGDLDYLRAVVGGAKPGFARLSGDDATCVEFCAQGGHGVISVSSHIIGKEMGEYLVHAATSGAEYARRFRELLKWLYIEANPIPVKMALHWMGVIDSPELRLPLSVLDETFHKEFKTCLKNLGKL